MTIPAISTHTLAATFHWLEPATTCPSSPVLGDTIYRTDLDRALTWDGASWVTIGLATPPPFYIDLTDPAYALRHRTVHVPRHMAPPWWRRHRVTLLSAWIGVVLGQGLGQVIAGAIR